MATKPLHPHLHRSTWACQPRCSASAAMSVYFNGLHSFASTTAASHGTVSSTMKKYFWEVDHMTRSGLRLVVMISGEKMSLFSKSTCIIQSRAESSRVDSTLAGGFAGSWPALRKGVVPECLTTGGWRTLLSSILYRVITSCLRTWLSPGIAALGQTCFAASENMPQGCGGLTESTRRIFSATHCFRLLAWKEYQIWLCWWSWFGFLPFTKDPSMWACDATGFPS